MKNENIMNSEVVMPADGIAGNKTNETTEKPKAGTNEKEVSKWFAWFHASSVNGTAMLIAAVVSSYFSVFMTDTMLIPAGTAATIMLIAFTWDAINDPIMGVIADRTRTKFGRYRPYFLVAPILLTIFGTLIWLNPDLSMTGKIIYVTITYIGYGMTVTLYTAPQMAVLPAAVKSDEERTRIVMLGGAFVAAMFTIGSTFTLPIIGFFEGLGFSNGYVPFMFICGLLACISFWGLFATSKENYLSYDTGEKTSIRSELVKVAKHKELYVYVAIWILAALGYGLMFGSSVYYMLYYLMRPDLIPVYMGVISVGALLSMVVVMPLFNKVFKGPKRALIASQVGAATLYILLFFFGGSSIAFLFVGSFIATCIASMQNALVNVLVNDAIDYVLFKDGTSANGVISSVKGFAQKCAGTMTNSGILFALALTGYVAGEIGGQNESTLVMINFLRFGLPAITGILIIIGLRFDPVEKVKGEIGEMKALMNAKNRD